VGQQHAGSQQAGSQAGAQAGASQHADTGWQQMLTGWQQQLFVQHPATAFSPDAPNTTSARMVATVNMMMRFIPVSFTKTTRSVHSPTA
jgi:hypothetical protein